MTRHRGLTEQAADAAIDSACRLLRLPTIRDQFGDLAEAAARDQQTYRGFLAELLMAECDDRARRRSERQLKAAAFPRDKSLRVFDSVAARMFQTLRGPTGIPAESSGESCRGGPHKLGTGWAI
jgi:DNA replication protein DnaC